MTSILDSTVASEVPNLIPQSLVVVSQLDAPMSFRSGRSTAAVQSQLRHKLSTPETRLWAACLLNLYRELVLTGPKGPAARQVEECGVQDLEIVALELGMPRGFVARLVGNGLKEWERRRSRRR